MPRSWQTLPDPDTLPPQTEPNLAALFDEIRTTVEQEAQIISAVFPDPLMVMTTFLQRVFAQSVQGYIEVLMSKAGEVGATGSRSNTLTAAGSVTLAPASPVATSAELGFLRILQMVRSMSLNLISDIKIYDGRSNEGGPSAAISSPSLLGGLSESHGDGSSHVHSGSSLSIMLESAVEDIFLPYMEGAKYLERESKNLTELYASYLAAFHASHRSTAKAKSTTIFDRVRAAAGGSNSPVNHPTGSSSTLSNSGQSAVTPSTATKTSAFSKISGFVDRARGASQPQQLQQATAVTEDDITGEATPTTTVTDQTEETEGELSLSVAERMLRWHAEAIGRCVDLSNQSDVAKNAFALLKVLAEAFLKSYLETAIDSSTAQLNAQDMRSAQMPDISLLKVVKQVELITTLWQHYVSVALLPLTSSSVTLRREMIIFNNHNLLRVEGKCDALVQKVVDNLLAYLGNRLATQKKNDFAPKNDELAFSRMNTDPCIACSEALERAVKTIKVSFSGANAESVLLEIGVSFHSMLLDHFKKYTVSAAGGLMLTKDLAMYQDAIATFGLPALNDRFEMLRSLGNLFIVQPSVLRGYMREGSLGKIDERLLHAFLLRRSDYAKEVRDISGLGGSDPGPSLSTDDDRSTLLSGGQTGSTIGSNVFGHNTHRDQGQLSENSRHAEGSRNGRLSVMLHDLERYASGHDQGVTQALTAQKEL